MRVRGLFLHKMLGVGDRLRNGGPKGKRDQNGNRCEIEVDAEISPFAVFREKRNNGVNTEENRGRVRAMVITGQRRTPQCGASFQ